MAAEISKVFSAISRAPIAWAGVANSALKNPLNNRFIEPLSRSSALICGLPVFADKMTTRSGVKLNIEILTDPKMGRLENHHWRHLIELFLLAGGTGDDGVLPLVEEMAWTLRLSNDRLLEDLHNQADIGVVHEAQPGAWVVTNFAKRQVAVPVNERVRSFKLRRA